MTPQKYLVQRYLIEIPLSWVKSSEDTIQGRALTGAAKSLPAFYRKGKSSSM
jgi:hypothetical protein